MSFVRPGSKRHFPRDGGVIVVLERGRPRARRRTAPASVSTPMKEASTSIALVGALVSVSKSMATHRSAGSEATVEAMRQSTPSKLKAKLANRSE